MISIIYPNSFKAGIACLATHILLTHLSKFGYNVGAYFLENYHLVRGASTIFITLQYENDYFNAIKIIRELREKNPNALFVAGGPCVMENLHPLEDFFDVFIVGEIEDSDVMDKVVRRDFSDSCLYIPNKTKKVKKIYPKRLGIEDYPIKQMTHEKGAYGKAFLLEIGRGCPRRCRFCLARAIYYPPRFRKLDDLIYLAERGVKESKVNKVALIAPSVGDYKYIVELCNYLNELNVQISPSSLRADTITDDLLRALKLKTLTIAPEAGSERLREYIRKDISLEDIRNAIELAKKHGIEKVKLYFMVGIPTETEDDIKELISLCESIKKEFRKVEITINPLIPKPHTDFENVPFDIESKRKIRFIEKNLKNVKVEYENFNSMLSQAVLARGDKKLGNYLKISKNYSEFVRYLKRDKVLDEYLKGLKAKTEMEL
ncbi:Radical SAM domain protein [Methanocaldococcus infernus ME]|uniref:Radical SAM domain protein n=1 Tax=Methanocaldococcus infernus (strain DSM 11812 / JCM 15783 / ME) TaxID=573063 RepID=D5VUC7_METIM|nr:radical SAM protein [Methanocaldococcus infernus]ADG12739.1 Radical SAM domain protein [Methanocaldococcus infernus ME]